MKKGKITLLDLGGVVFQSTGISNGLINWPIITSLNDKYGHELNIGKNKFPEFMVEYNLLTNQNLSGKKFLEAVFDTLEINQELIDMVQRVSSIVIVSDNYRENIEYISERFEFSKWADKQYYSYE